MVISIVILLQSDAIQKDFYSSIRNSDKYSDLVISLSNVQHGRNATERGSILSGDTGIQHGMGKKSGEWMNQRPQIMIHREGNRYQVTFTKCALLHYLLPLLVISNHLTLRRAQLKQGVAEHGLWVSISCTALR